MLILTFSGVDQSLISTCLSNDVLGTEVKIYRGVVSGTTCIADPFLIFHGHLSNFQVNDGGKRCRFRNDDYKSFWKF